MDLSFMFDQPLGPRPIEAGLSLVANQGTGDVSVSSGTYSQTPVAGGVRVGSETPVLLLRDGRQVTILEGGGYEPAV
ncbi:MAG: hypothetical protein AB7S38_29055 [Vulcanimicrobiota bacterium]